MKRHYPSGFQKRAEKRRKEQSAKENMGDIAKYLTGQCGRNQASQSKEDMHENEEVGHDAPTESRPAPEDKEGPYTLESESDSCKYEEVSTSLADQDSVSVTVEPEPKGKVTTKSILSPRECKGHQLDSDTKRYIMNSNLHQPKGPFPKDKDGRSFSEYYYFVTSTECNVKIPRFWIGYSAGNDIAYCLPCWLFADQNDSNFQLSWTRGIKHWQSLSKRIKSHESSSSHVNACITGSCWKLNTTIDKQLEEVKRKEISFWCQVLERVVSVILMLARNNLSFRGHRENMSEMNGNFLQVIELLGKFDPVLKQLLEKAKDRDKIQLTYLSPRIQNEIIEILSRKVKENIAEEIRNAPCYTIILDSTQDVSKVDQLSIIFRYLTFGMDETGKTTSCDINESFLGFIPMKNQTAEAMQNAVVTCMELNNIPVNKLRGQGYDGAANMSGSYAGLQKRFQDLQPNAHYVHCAAHSLNLVINDAVRGVKQISNFFDIIQEVYVFFGHSIKRWDLLSSFTSESEVTLKSLNPTRWSGRLQSLLGLKLRCTDVLKALARIILQSNKRDEIAEAASLQNKLESIEMVLTLLFMSHILNVLNVPSQLLQKLDVDLSMATAKLLDAKQSLVKYREEFELVLQEARAICNKWGISVEFTKKRVPRRKKQYDKLCLDDAREAFDSPETLFRVKVFNSVLDIAIGQITTRFRSMELVMSNFSLILPHKLPSLTEEDVKASATRLVQIYPELQDSHALTMEVLQMQTALGNDLRSTKSVKDLAELIMVKYSAIASSFPKLISVISIFLTLPVTIASAERSFSKLKLVKNYLRSTMSQERLTGLALLSIEGRRVKELDLRNIISLFAEAKVRKVSLR